MMFALSLLVSLASASTFPETTYMNAYRNWTRKYSKKYEVTEFVNRYENFKVAVDFVTAHNLGGYSYTVALNEFADMTNEEFRAQQLGYKPSERTGSIAHLKNGDNPDSVDWTTKGAVTPIKNQGQCGSCWAFSTTGSVEGANFLTNGNLVSFSEQELVDCAGSFGNQGCNGGLMDNAFKYIQQSGLCQESDYPYTGVGGTCQTTCQSAVKVSSYTDVPQKDLDTLETSVAQQPVSVAVDASGMSWQLYSGGIMKGGIFGCGTKLDHGVLAVGYGTANGKQYWKVKNSWGATWGEQGFVRLAKSSGTGSGTCGIALSASYPTV